MVVSVHTQSGDFLIISRDMYCYPMRKVYDVLLMECSARVEQTGFCDLILHFPPDLLAVIWHCNYITRVTLNNFQKLPDNTSESTYHPGGPKRNPPSPHLGGMS